MLCDQASASEFRCSSLQLNSLSQGHCEGRPSLGLGTRMAKSISNWHLIGYNEGYCSNTGYILLPCFHGIRLWIWPEPLVAPRLPITHPRPQAPGDEDADYRVIDTA